MSRTLVHRPERAWFDDASRCVPVHDHTTGGCDLPTLVVYHRWLSRHPGEDEPWHCGWSLLWEEIARLCGCRLCTGHHWNRMDRRSDRHRARVWLATGAWVDEYAEVAVR